MLGENTARPSCSIKEARVSISPHFQTLALGDTQNDSIRQKLIQFNIWFNNGWPKFISNNYSIQGGRSWQPYSESKNSHKIFRLGRIRYVRDICIFIASDCKVANLIQYNMQYIPCTSDLLAQETLFLTQKKDLFLKRKCVNCGNPIISRQNSVCYFWIWLYSIQQNIHSTRKPRYRPPLSNTEKVWGS